MKNIIVTFNNSFLFLSLSLYLGSGWALLLFMFPVLPKLTPESYPIYLLPQLTAATEFFKTLTIIMILCVLIMIIAEWKSWLRWFPIILLLGIGAATYLGVKYLVPYYQMLQLGVTDQNDLDFLLENWVYFSKSFVFLLTFQWFCMMAYFAVIILDYRT